MNHRAAASMLARLGFPFRAPDDLAGAALAELRRAWQRGERLSTARLLCDYPELADRHSAVLELAYEEAHLRIEAGEKIDLHELFASLPGYASDVRDLFSVHRFIGDNRDLLSGSTPQTPATIDWPMPGETVSGFELISELGHGGFARVYLARQQALAGRLVALKLSPEGPSEAETLARLQHPNIVPVYSAQVDAAMGLTMTCMPYLGRATLAHLLTRLRADPRLPLRAGGLQKVVAELHASDDAHASPRDDRLPPRAGYVDVVLQWGAQLADALECAHAQSICHRDIKPSNVLLTADSWPMLLDFNLAQDPLAPLVRFGGTLPYMAPEQIQSMLATSPSFAAPADPRSDLFSLGVVLFELLGGSPPFAPPPEPGDSAAQTDNATFAQHAARWWQLHRGGPRSLQRLNRRIDAELARLVEGLLAFDPANRPQTAGRLAASLRRCLRRRCRWARWSRAHRGAVSCGAAVVAVALAAGSYPLIAQRQPSLPLAIAQERLQAGDFKGAFTSLEGAAFEQRDWRYYALRGRTCSLLGDFPAALESFARAQRDRDAAEIAAALGDCQLAEGRFEHALSSYERALSMGFESAGLANNLGVALLERFERQKASQWFCRALELDDGLQAAHFNRAKLAYILAAEARQEPPPMAREEIEAAIAAGPPNDAVFLLAAKIYYSDTDRDRRQQGLEYLLESIRLGLDLRNAERAGMVREMAGLLRQRGEFASASEAGARCARSDPPSRADSLAGVPLDWSMNPQPAT